MRVLAVIIDYYDTPQAAALSLALARYPGVEVVHVDNGMSPPVLLSDQQHQAGVKLLRTGSNLGYAGGLNRAIQQSDPDRRFDAYWMLNSDLRIEPDCLPALIRTLFGNERTAAVGPVVKFDAPPFEVWGARGRVSPWLGTTAMLTSANSDPLPRWSYIPGCSLLVRATAYRELGGLPEFYRLYYEETHFCIQLQKKGWNLKIVPDAIAYHRVNSMRAGVPARHFAYYFTRNNLRFWKTCFGIPIWVQLPRTLLVAAKEVLLPIRRAQSWSEAKDRLRYLAAGLMDGLAFARGRPSRFEKRLFPD